ncbi:Ankyrin repeat-containing domain protein [Rhypophila sp. PSN 637]
MVWWNAESTINPTHEWFHAVDPDTWCSNLGEEHTGQVRTNCPQCPNLRFDMCGAVAYQDLPLYLYGRCADGCVVRDELEHRAKKFWDYYLIYLESDDDDSSRDAVEGGRIKNVELLNPRGIAVGDAGLYLYLAARRGHVDTAKMFLSKETVSAEVEEFGSTALHAAAEWGHLPMVQILIDGEADTMRRDRSGKTAIEQAMAAGETKIVERLLDCLSALQTTPTTAEHDDRIALREKASSWLEAVEIRDAIDRGDLWQLKHLLESNGSLDVNTLRLPSCRRRRPTSSESWMLPLHRAVMNHKSDPAILQLLLKRGADFTLVDADGNTGIHWAAASGYHQALHTWLRKKPWCTIYASSPRPVGHPEPPKDVYDSFFARATNKAGNTPLHLAIRYGTVAKIEALQEFYHDAYARNADGYTPLDFAAASGESGRSLISSELGRDLEGSTESSKRLLEKVQFLVLSREISTRGASLLQHVCHGMLCDAGGSDELVKKLLEDQDIKAYQEDAYGRSPLHLAVRSANPDIARLLLAHGGVDVNARDRDGMTALHTAVVAGRRSSVQLLLSHGVGVGVVDMQARDYNGRTALHHAAYFRLERIFRDLVAASAAGFNGELEQLVESRDMTNQRPYEIAESRGIIGVRGRFGTRQARERLLAPYYGIPV